jgi:MFS family permease
MPAASMPAASARQIGAATRAVYLTFGCSGVAVASWASRIPQVRDGLGLTPSTLGLVLLSAAIGSLLAVPSCGSLVARFGSRRVLVAATVLLGVGLLTVAFGYLVSVLPVVCGLFLVGMAFGAWEVALNVQGAAVERMLGRAILARFHAGFSIGTVAGALVGVGVVTLRVPVTVHLAAAGVLVVAVVLVLSRSFVPDRDSTPGSAEPRPHDGLGAWLEPRTLLIGVLGWRSRWPRVPAGTGSAWPSSTATAHRPSSAPWRTRCSWPR